MLDAWEFIRVKAYLGKDGLDSQDMETVDLSEPHAADPEQMGAQVKIRLITPGFTIPPFGGRSVDGVRNHFGIHLFQVGFDFTITGLDLLLVV